MALTPKQYDSIQELLIRFIQERKLFTVYDIVSQLSVDAGVWVPKRAASLFLSKHVTADAASIGVEFDFVDIEVHLPERSLPVTVALYYPAGADIQLYFGPFRFPGSGVSPATAEPSEAASVTTELPALSKTDRVRQKIAAFSATCEFTSHDFEMPSDTAGKILSKLAIAGEIHRVRLGYYVKG